LFCMSFVSICFESSETVQSEDRRSNQERYGLISLTHHECVISVTHASFALF